MWVLRGLSAKHSDSCDHDSLAASTCECRAGSGRAWIGKCGRGGEDCTNIVCMKVAMLCVWSKESYPLFSCSLPRSFRQPLTRNEDVGDTWTPHPILSVTRDLFHSCDCALADFVLLLAYDERVEGLIVLIAAVVC